jgi:hypothetical protein
MTAPTSARPSGGAAMAVTMANRQRAQTLRCWEPVSCLTRRKEWIPSVADVQPLNKNELEQSLCRPIPSQPPRCFQHSYQPGRRPAAPFSPEVSLPSRGIPDTRMVLGTPCPITALPSERQPSSDLRDTVAMEGTAQAMSSLGTANGLLRRCGLPGFLDSLDELQPVVFVALLQRMLSREFESEFARPSAHAHAHMHTSELMHTSDGALSLSLALSSCDRQTERASAIQ